MSQHHDPDVGDALRRLDVPDHAPGFWATLDVALGDGGGPEREAPDQTDTDDEEPDVVHLRERAERRGSDRRRAPMLGLAAAAAVVIALVVGAAVLGGGGDDRDSTVDVADDPTETSVPDETADTTVPDVALTPPETRAMSAEDAEAAAAEWLDTLFAGDVEGAYALLDDVSRERMPLDEFEQMGAGLFEGAAAFAQDGIERSVLQVETASGFVSVVTFSGDVEREGMIETASYPVVVTDTGVHFTLGGPELSIDPEYADASGTTLTSPLVMSIGADVPEVWVWTVGAGADVLDPVEERGRVEIDVESAGGPGTNLVTLLAVDGDLFVARSHTVVVP